VAILGGLGNSMAAVGAGLLLGILEAFSISVVPLAFKDAIAITILLLILFRSAAWPFRFAHGGKVKAF
jgi:branched-chain amino acid transport system permease protein